MMDDEYSAMILNCECDETTSITGITCRNEEVTAGCSQDGIKGDGNELFLKCNSDSGDAHARQHNSKVRHDKKSKGKSSNYKVGIKATTTTSTRPVHIDIGAFAGSTSTSAMPPYPSTPTIIFKLGDFFVTPSTSTLSFSRASSPPGIRNDPTSRIAIAGPTTFDASGSGLVCHTGECIQVRVAPRHSPYSEADDAESGTESRDIIDMDSCRAAIHRAMPEHAHGCQRQRHCRSRKRRNKCHGHAIKVDNE
jgi:hypothetical protein